MRQPEINQPFLESEHSGEALQKKINIARNINAFLTTTGMISIGLLAMLETHNNVEKNQHWPLPAVITIDCVAFFTALMGKVAIVLYFNESEFLSGFEKIIRNEIPHFFKLKNKSFLSLFGWMLNILMSLNSCLFWTGLAQVSFIKSGELLNEYESSVAKTAGNLISQPYFFLFFVLSSLYANIFSWPGIHIGGYHLQKSFFQWLNQHNDYRLLKEDITTRMKNTHRHLMLEMKQATLNIPDAFPIVQALHNQIIFAANGENPTDSIHNMIQNISIADAKQLRHAYIALNAEPHTPESSVLYYLKRFISFALSGLSVYGFRNILGLAEMVWDNWGMKRVASYGAGLFAYYSIAVVVFLTVYPTLNNLLNLHKEGIPPHVFSHKTLLFILSMVFFIGICGGLANAEQSDLDGESTLDVANADISSFLIDSFAIYMIPKNYLENKISAAPLQNENEILQFKKHFITLKNTGNHVCNIDHLSEYDLKELAEHAKKNNEAMAQSNPNYLSLPKGSRRFQIFKARPLRTETSLEFSNSPLLQSKK
ncbi:MAG: hypothetical protein A3F10_01740 [Coxiella sp. RIFCSPHIGHO2_12_FULL_42_15]|nr:MAG: hypothetical protein A3F10_01740 [Coxiella sp. RIFCSPHIGHO2_12_FULL_42_15]